MRSLQGDLHRVGEQSAGEGQLVRVDVFGHVEDEDALGCVSGVDLFEEEDVVLGRVDSSL